VVAVEVRLKSGPKRYFMTWGRVQDVDALEALVLDQCPTFDLGGVAAKARLCDTLQDASREPYFYEALVYFSQQRPSRTEAWRTSMDRKMRKGKDLYYLGRR
jgi:hypothetical protein